MLKTIALFLATSFMCNVTAAESFDWSTFDSLLKNHVKSGAYQSVQANLVDYDALRNDSSFKTIGQQLAQYNPTALSGNDKLVYYINAYNYFAIKIVLDNWPVDGIKDIGSLFKPVWKREAGKINGRAVTLDEIEHKILRPMGEPRVHFAIVCASMSCPDLRTEAYRAETLDQQLSDQAQTFLSNTTKGAALKNGKLYLSEIFDWFEEDFSKVGGIYAFIDNYNPALENFEDFEIIPYNWELNRQR